MREEIYVRLMYTQLVSLQKLLGELCSDEGLDQYPEVKQFVTDAMHTFTDEHPLIVGNVLAKAQEVYSDAFEPDLDIDPDAPLKFCDNGVWVGAWVWLGEEHCREKVDCAEN